MEYPMTIAGRNLIERLEKDRLTEIEKKIILTMASIVNSTDEEDKSYEFPIQNFYEMLGLEGLDSNVIFKEIVEELLSKVVEIPREHGGWMMTHWIESVEYIEGSDMIRFGLSPDIKPYFLQLKRYLSP